MIPVVRQGHPYYLVLFQTPDGIRQRRKAARPARREKKAPPRSRISKLEEELAATREYLQSTIQEIEAANEELQSANEEILSSNEELQSTNEELDTAKEELQSTNEELNTVNDELHARNEELTRVNADLLNLLASVQIAIVIVARDLRVRRFTPMAEKKFNLIPSDIGRPLSQISTTLQCPGAAGAHHRNDRHRLSRGTHGSGQQGRNLPAAHPARTRRRTTASTARSSRSSISIPQKDKGTEDLADCEDAALTLTGLADCRLPTSTATADLLHLEAAFRQLLAMRRVAGHAVGADRCARRFGGGHVVCGERLLHSLQRGDRRPAPRSSRPSTFLSAQ